MDLRQTGEVTTTQEKDQEIIIKKILIGVDESGNREKITRCGLTLARSLGADATAIHVIDRSSIDALGDLSGLIGYYEGEKLTHEQALRKHAKELLDKTDILAKKEGIKITVEAIMNASSVAEGIIDYASSTNVDLIVIGIKGKTGIAKFHIGGIADKVVSHAHCSVMTVR
jgi:nucleotide-binding universal stress UspA family protein